MGEVDNLSCHCPCYQRSNRHALIPPRSIIERFSHIAGPDCRQMQPGSSCSPRCLWLLVLVRFEVLIFNYQITNLRNYQILGANKTVRVKNEHKILVIAKY